MLGCSCRVDCDLVDSPNLSRPVTQKGKDVRVRSWLESKLLVITSLSGGSGDKTDKLKSIGGVASARLHLQPLFRAADELNLNPRLLSLDVDRPSILSELGQPDLCVIGKVNHHDDSRAAGFAMATLSAVARLKARNVRIVLLYCDHLAPLACVRGSLYRDLLILADQIIVPCKAMADRALEFLQSPTQVTIIEDPWQVRLHNYRSLQKRVPLRLGWFGNTNNVFFLRDNLRELMRKINVVPSVELAILSSQVSLNIVKEEFSSSLPSAIIPWKLKLLSWDDFLQPDQLEQFLESLDVVWLPSNPDNNIKSGVSHNRLVDSIRSGSVVVASAMQSYQELSKLALLGSNHAELINKLIPEYNRLISKYEPLRIDLLERFSPIRNQALWKRELVEALKLCK